MPCPGANPYDEIYPGGFTSESIHAMMRYQADRRPGLGGADRSRRAEHGLTLRDRAALRQELGDWLDRARTLMPTCRPASG